jgi:hypothetical protein
MHTDVRNEFRANRHSMGLRTRPQKEEGIRSMAAHKQLTRICFCPFDFNFWVNYEVLRHISISALKISVYEWFVEGGGR